MKLFENLPSTNTPISAENLNQIQDKLVVVSATEPTGDDREKVWLQKGKNLFNKSNIINDCYIDSAGVITTNIDWCITDFMRVNPNTEYSYFGLTNTGNAPYSVFYDKNKNFISSFKQSTGNNTITIPANAYYVRFSIILTDTNYGTIFDDINVFQLEQGIVTEYEEYIEPKIYVKNDNDVYEEFINKDMLINYSTGEQRIGTWIDGKPLYRKVIETKSPTVATDKTATWKQVTIPDVSFGMVVGGCVELAENTFHPILHFRSGDGVYYIRSDFAVNSSNRGILEIVSNNIAYNDKLVIAIVEYTKTTD